VMAGRQAPPAKKRSVVPLVVGAVVVLGAVGGAVAVLGKKDGTGAVPPDTARQVAAANTTGTTKTPTPAGGTKHPAGEAVLPLAIDPGKAGAALDALQDMIDAQPLAARDSALKFYNAVNVSAVDKATAAFVIANTYWKRERDRQRGCDWIGRAMALDARTQTYATLHQTQCGN